MTMSRKYQFFFKFDSFFFTLDISFYNTEAEAHAISLKSGHNVWVIIFNETGKFKLSKKTLKSSTIWGLHKIQKFQLRSLSKNVNNVKPNCMIEIYKISQQSKYEFAN